MADKGMTANQVMQAVVEALQSKKAKEVKVLETGELTILADYFVICTATSTTHIKTLSDEVQKQLEEKGETILHVEGYRSGGWVLIDLGCVIVHIFLDEQREFYSLERLWGDAKEIAVEEK